MLESYFYSTKLKTEDIIKNDYIYFNDGSFNNDKKLMGYVLA